MAAAPPPEGLGMNALLQGHPGVARAAVEMDAALLLPSAEGLQSLRRGGYGAYIEDLRRHLAAHGAPAPAHWRLCDTWPEQLDCPLAEFVRGPLPGQPVLLAERHDGLQCELDLHLPLDLRYFAEHFPALPVLPGVVQIAWALDFAAARLGTPAQCRRLEMLKFQRLLRPGDRVSLQLRHDPAAGKLYFTYRHDGADDASGRLAWEATRD
jgi:hypothetical protein